MTDTNFTRIMDGLNEALRHASGEEVPGMVIHRIDVRRNEIAFERAVRDYYLVSRDDDRSWSDIRPEERAYWRQRLMQAVHAMDEWISRQVDESTEASAT